MKQYNKEVVIDKLNYLKTIVEMEDHPDQRVAALSRKEVANLLANKEVYDENGDLEYTTGLELSTEEGSPWELGVSYVDDEEVDDTEIGATLLDLLSGNVDNDEEVEIELADGSFVYVEAADAKELYERDAKAFINALKDINTFASALGIEQEISVKESLTHYVEDWLYSLVENDSVIGQSTDFNKHRRKVGRKLIKNRIIGGKAQYKVQRSGVKGFKISGDSVTRIKPAEARKRKIGARIAARKRRAKMSQIIRRRARSTKIRANRFGD